MTSTLSILGAKGDTKFTWDPADPADCERMRRTIADLKRAGYSFFLTDNTPADELSGDPQGTLIVRKLEPAEIVPELPAEAPAPKRRGRPPKAKPAEGQDVIAVRPVRGG